MFGVKIYCICYRKLWCLPCLTRSIHKAQQTLDLKSAPKIFDIEQHQIDQLKMSCSIGKNKPGYLFYRRCYLV